MTAPQDKQSTPRKEETVQKCTPLRYPWSKCAICNLHLCRLVKEVVPLDQMSPRETISVWICPHTGKVV
jgi:hypothetical protein